MPSEAPRKKPGPKASGARRRQAGYRLTDRQRFELQTAALFVGVESLQEVIDTAVGEFIARMNGVDGYTAALKAAEAHQRQRAGVPTLRADRDVRSDASD